MSALSRQPGPPFGNTAPYAPNAAKSMTIDEMRQLHRQAQMEAEAKKTELRLVLASRYRELVGSSDEVTTMRERAKELDDLVHNIPLLMKKLVECTKEQPKIPAAADTATDNEKTKTEAVNVIRLALSQLPRNIHRSLDKKDVHRAARSLIELFTLISSQTNAYPLATVLGAPSMSTETFEDPLMRAQIKMILLHVQALPAKTVKMAKRVLLSSAASLDDPNLGAKVSASALSALDLLDLNRNAMTPQQHAVKWIDLYFDSKAQLLQKLLGELATTSPDSSTGPIANRDKGVANASTTASKAQEILSKIVLILQYDVILHPYQVFVLRSFVAESDSTAKEVISTLPPFDADLLQTKASHFLAAHLPLIRTKVKTILKTIAGTTASALGHIRQHLYDKTDGVDCMERLDGNGICTWDEAVAATVDVRIVSQGTTFATERTEPVSATSKVGSTPTKTQTKRFSLWGALFSNTFSSLVHSLLTTSFYSVHTKVVSTLRTSLSNAPPLTSVLPHEAYRNTLYIATELDASLKKVSDDAHELLVHAEEREESERRLRQSLYVQTCEIMGRLLSELRRMLLVSSNSPEEAATKELIVGRLCHLLKFRLTSLPTLLSPNSSPAVLASNSGVKSGMVTLLELQSAFDLSDDNDDGLITFEEAMEAMESAFSGTSFHGAEMVRDTLLLRSAQADSVDSSGGTFTTPRNVTLSELVLLSARGLRHEKIGTNSALGTFQKALDDIINVCFEEWSKVALTPSMTTLSEGIKGFMDMAYSESDEEWKRTHQTSDSESAHHMMREIGEALKESANGKENSLQVGTVSPHIVGCVLSVASVLNRSVCPSDSLPPVSSAEYAEALGISSRGKSIPSMMQILRWALVGEALTSMTRILKKEIMGGERNTSLSKSGACAMQQLSLDLSFTKLCFFERNQIGFRNEDVAEESNETIVDLLDEVSLELIRASAVPPHQSALNRSIKEKSQQVLHVCDLFFSALFGEEKTTENSASLQGADMSGIASADGSAPPMLYNPLPSSRRFVLLPIQSERSLNELQLRSKFAKDKEDIAEGTFSTSAAVSSGFGFFSSMLKKSKH